MITVSLVLCFIPVSCQNGEPIPEQFSDEDAVTVRLNLSTRGVESGGSVMLDNYSSDPANWYKTGTLFPQAPAQPRIALMVFNKEQNPGSRSAQDSAYGFQQGAEPVCVQPPASFQFR